jgi:hypothetical protein
MNSKKYARIANDTVVEFVTTTSDIGELFHRDLQWIDVTDLAAIACGWKFDDGRFTPPLPAATEPVEEIIPDQELAVGSSRDSTATSPPA